MNNWKETTLGEVGRIVTGKTPPTACLDYYGGNIPFVTPRDMDYRKEIDTTERYLTKEGVEVVKGSYIQAKSIMVSCIGSDMGKVAVASKDCVTNQQINSIIVDDTHYCSEYIYYNLSQRQAEFQSLSGGGSALPILNKGHFAQITITCPTLPEQKVIAAVLSSFDNKIELLRRQNKTLEKIAQTIFKEWFVNFNFPDKNGKPYKSSVGKMVDSDSEFEEIPEDWRVGTVNDVIERFSITYRCEKEDIEPGGKTPILDQGSTGLYGHTSRQADFEASTENPVIVFANHTCNMWFINYPFCAIQNIIPFRGNAEYSTFFVFCMTLGQISFIEYKGHWPDFEQKEYVIPKPDVANKFAEIVKPFQYKIWNDNSQIQTLSRLRDYLLPKLMKGEIRVKF